MTDRPETERVDALADALRKTAPGRMWPVDMRRLREVSNAEFAAGILAALTGLGWSVERRGEDELRAAWAMAEAALPEAWGIASVVRAAGEAGQWRVWAGDLRALDYDEQFITWADGPTPAAALRALTAALRGGPDATD